MRSAPTPVRAPQVPPRMPHLLLPVLADVRRVVVLRALRAAFPQAHITLVGHPWVRDLALRLPSIDAFVALPGWPGLHERPLPDPAALLALLQQLHHQKFDLALQMHGSGRVANALVAAFGTTATAGFLPPGGWHRPGDGSRYVLWPEHGSEVERLLRLTPGAATPAAHPHLARASQLSLNLTQVPRDFYLVTDAVRSTHRSGRCGALPWGDNVYAAPVEQLARMQFDVVLYQSRGAWDDDRLNLLSPAQRALPRIVLEHDPPQQHPTNTVHWCQDPGTLLVHVTAFSALMWDNGGTPVCVIDHGVKLLAEPRWTGHLPRGLVVVNNLQRRGRRLGRDLWQALAPLAADVAGGHEQR